MKQIMLGLLGGVLILAACAPAAAVTTTSPSPSQTPTLLSPTFTPSRTPIPATETITPLPTIPTFTATFDANTIVTVTPASQAECPKIDPVIKPENYLPKKIEYPAPNVPDKIIEFLNNGGNGQSLVRKLDQIYSKTEYSGGYAFLDVTSDQIPEFLYVELYYGERPIVFSCKNGKYEILDILSGRHDFDFYEMEFEDLNADGIPEIIVTGTGGVSFPISTIYLYEWNGRTFSILGEVSILALRQTQIKNIDENGTKEIILIGDNPGCLSCSNFIPQRQRAITYGWNGKEFVEISNEFEPPEYRFQAIHDADNTVHFGKLDKAFSLYTEVISNEKLEWWSPERFSYEQDASYRWIPGYTSVPEPIVDLTEYPRLAAYAYYRIMLLHIVQGHELDAGTVYKTLQQKFGNDPYGQPYVEMAAAFWDTYQSTHKIYDGCAAAIEYAAEHPDILIPLGSDYHGSQSHTYVPADVCPFR